MKIEDIYKLFLEYPVISTDTRKIEENSIFFALKGDNFNGNAFASQALENGAKYAVIDDADYDIDAKYILVDDVLKTLQNLAIYHRNNIKADVIVIGGSNGKTTVKELVSLVLSKKYNTFTTPGNLNNHIGVPLSILKIKPDIEKAVIEIGANHQDENYFLCQIARADYGLVTNCGKDHLEGFGSVEGVIQSNSEIYKYLNENDGIAFVNVNDEIQICNTLNNKRILFGNSNENITEQISIRGLLTDKFPFVSIKVTDTEEEEEFYIKSHLFGSFQLNNILTAVSIGRYFNIDSKLIKEAIESYIPKNNRSQLIQWKCNSVLLDAYNANPSSMIPMIEDFNNFNTSNKIVVLGDMFELGKDSEYEHNNIVNLLKNNSFVKTILVGKEFKKHKHLIDCEYFNNYQELKEWLNINKIENSFFLVKGSRGMMLEKAFM